VLRATRAADAREHVALDERVLALLDHELQLCQLAAFELPAQLAAQHDALAAVRGADRRQRRGAGHLARLALLVALGPDVHVELEAPVAQVR
jgi:hypothetical protein